MHVDTVKIILHDSALLSRNFVISKYWHTVTKADITESWAPTSEFLSCSFQFTMSALSLSWSAIEISLDLERKTKKQAQRTDTIKDNY